MATIEKKSTTLLCANLKTFLSNYVTLHRHRNKTAMFFYYLVVVVVVIIIVNDFV